jgi:antitoxin component YwqK of YwqJK toxin-antitoxin module
MLKNSKKVKDVTLLVVLFLCTSSILLWSCKSAGNRITERFPNGKPEVVHEMADRDDTLNYTLKVYYPDGQVKRVAQVVNGMYVGIITSYFGSGKIYEIDSLTAPCRTDLGNVDGNLTRYYENGNLCQKFSVKNGHFNGMSFHYDNKGTLAKMYTLLDDSIKNGIYKEFYDDGRVLRLATFHMDTLVGNEYIFKENGDTLKYYAHYQGQMDFPYKIWLDDGRTVYGVRVGEVKVCWTWYDKNGHVMKKQIESPSPSGYTIPH